MPKALQITVFNEDEKMKTRKRKIAEKESNPAPEANKESRKEKKRQWRLLVLM